ncbi:hypothetical protein V6N11_081773 [Hibiscus sabdariffa]|uniref:Uncharacterized protein n=1 Tax=Hibiscus sabdariffa TaxID=183260 RepID=A0ABR2Q739_9ROSI
MKSLQVAVVLLLLMFSATAPNTGCPVIADGGFYLPPGRTAVRGTMVVEWMDFGTDSLVDGYNLPVSVATRPFSPKCTIRGCSKNLNNLCAQELQVVNKDGKVVACRSACLAFDIDSFCCRNEYGTPEKFKPSVYSKIFKVKDACRCYYSYAFDMPPPLVNCASKEYVITFCSSAWGTDQASI